MAANLVEVAKQRCSEELAGCRIQFQVGDMCDDRLGEFDHVVAMDSLIHYDCDDIVQSVGGLVDRARTSVLFTFAPGTAALLLMHRVGRLFPHMSRRAPAIVPVAYEKLSLRLEDELGPAGWRVGDTLRISSGFYKSQLLEMRRG